ncbi:MAG: hypothetical protein ACRD22_17605, partial [Terriglobia bacterium]
LKGKCQARPEESANFPESWNQRQFRLTQLLQDANNPLIAPILEHPQNMRLAKDALGVSDFAMPEGDAYQKQLGEFEMLRRSGPLPNPAAQQAMQQVQQLLMQAQQNPQLMQIAQQTAEQAKAIPPEISSVAIDPIFDLHSAEYQACADFINSPEGRAMKNGTQKERMGFANIRLHALEHKAHIQPSKSGDIKPPHISVNYRDLPPAAAAEALQQAGVGVPPAAVKDERASSTELKRLGKTPLNPEGA